MRGDLPAVALRLLQSLPVRTHSATDPAAGPGGARQMLPGATKRGLPLAYVGKQGRPRPVRVGTTSYASVSEAARKRHVALRTIYDALRNGKAEYVK